MATKISPITIDFENRIETAYEALQAANLNYIVEQSEHILAATGGVSELTKGLYRSDTKAEIGSVGIGYEPVQNVKAFAFFDTICQTHGAVYKSATSFNGGAKVILKAEFPKPVTIIKGDDVKKQFILVNGFDGKIGLHANFWVERLVCTNGLVAIVPDAKNSVHLKHTKNIEIRMEDAMKVLIEGLNYFDKFIEMSKILAQKVVDVNMVDNFLKDVFGESKSKQTKNIIEDVINRFENGMGNKGKTAWDLYNSVTEYIDYKHGRDINRLENSLLGNGSKKKAKAFNAAMVL